MHAPLQREAAAYQNRVAQAVDDCLPLARDTLACSQQHTLLSQFDIYTYCTQR